MKKLKTFFWSALGWGLGVPIYSLDVAGKWIAAICSMPRVCLEGWLRAAETAQVNRFRQWLDKQPTN